MTGTREFIYIILQFFVHIWQSLLHIICVVKTFSSCSFFVTSFWGCVLKQGYPVNNVTYLYVAILQDNLVENKRMGSLAVRRIIQLYQAVFGGWFFLLTLVLN